MDSKCLESFLIPEYEIATESIKDKMKNIFKTIQYGFLRLLKNLVIFFKNLISKMKHGRTIHNDKATYRKNKVLVDKYINTITYLIIQIPMNLSYITTTIFSVNAYCITAKNGEDPYEEYINECENKYQKLYDKFIEISKGIPELIYLDEYDHDVIIKRLSDSTDRLERSIEKIKNEVNRVLEDDSLYDMNADIVNEQQRRINEFMSFIPKYTKLFNELKTWISTHVSNDIITYDDKYKFYEDEK